MLEDKIKEAEQVLRLAAEMSKTYYHKPLIICYSGGKDSDVMLDKEKVERLTENTLFHQAKK